MGLEIEVFVRPFEIGRRQKENIKRLEALEDDGQIDNLKKSVWTSRIDTEVNNPVVRRFNEFKGWAENNGKTLNPYFDLRCIHSTFTDERREVLILPCMAVAVYSKGVLKGVFPCSDANNNYSIDRFVSVLESEKNTIGDAVEPSSSDDPTLLMV
ncbi:MAG: HTH domain-containing protein [Halobacteria archaeon]|nr:HTH domain-containing protein [Halobacteria archaeon]